MRRGLSKASSMSIPPPSDEGPWNRTYHRGRRPRRPLLAGVGFAVAGVGFAVAAVFAFVRWRPFRVEVRGSSMIPSLTPGEWALAVTPSRYGRGDVVVVEHPDR